MYNLLIAAGAGLAAYGLGWLAASWVAGFIPAILAFGITYVVLARRTGKAVEALAKQAMAVLQAGKLDEARAQLESALPLGKWQFLVGEQVHSQLGSLDYVQGVGLAAQRQSSGAKARYASARSHLEKSWSRDWRARCLLAALHHREGRHDDAVAVLEGVSGPAKKEAMFWGLYAWILHEARKRDQALTVLGRGLTHNKDSSALREMQEAMTNHKKPNMQVFGESWYQFFPEDIPREKLMQMQGANTAPGPKPRPQKTWPQPRR